MAADQAENQYGISWHDSAWIPILNPENVLEYFSQRTNPFYDRTCNNEMIKMQRLDMSQLAMMQGLEYILLHVQNPILFIIRKQHRHSPTQVTPLADYYILAGVVYQCPDLGSLINSRMGSLIRVLPLTMRDGLVLGGNIKYWAPSTLSVLHNLTSAFDEAFSYARYHPSKGYWWEFKDSESKVPKDDVKKSKKEKSKTAPSSLFQRQHVDLLLEELIKKFPPQRVKFPVTSTETSSAESKGPKDVVQKVEASSSSRASQDAEQNQSLGKRSLANETTDKPPPSKKRK